METIKVLYASQFAGQVEVAIAFLRWIEQDAKDKGYKNIHIRGGRYEDTGDSEFRLVGNK